MRSPRSHLSHWRRSGSLRRSWSRLAASALAMSSLSFSRSNRRARSSAPCRYTSRIRAASSLSRGAPTHVDARSLSRPPAAAQVVLMGKAYWKSVINWQTLGVYGVINPSDVDELLFTDDVQARRPFTAVHHAVRPGPSPTIHTLAMHCRKPLTSSCARSRRGRRCGMTRWPTQRMSRDG